MGNKIKEIKSKKIKRVNLRNLLGKHKFSKPTEKLIKKMDEELYNDG